MTAMTAALLKKLPSAPLARAMSTQAAAATSSSSADAAADGAYSFVKARTAYRAEVAALRQEFITEVARRKEKLARDAEYVACWS